MKGTQTAVDVVVQGHPKLSTIGATGLTFDICGFRDEIISIAKRGEATIQVMEQMGATPERLERERVEQRRDVMNLRVRVTAQFSEVVGKIITDAGLS